MGRDKALLPWPPGAIVGTWRDTFLGAAISRLNSVCDLVIVVAGANAKTLEPVVYSSGAEALLVNPEPERGQFSSLRIGLREVLNRGRDAAFVALVDRPPAKASTHELLRWEFMNSGNDCWAVVPEFEGEHGHPVVMAREMMELMLRAPAESNARDVMHANQSHVRYVGVDDATVVANINTPEDYERLGS